MHLWRCTYITKTDSRNISVYYFYYYYGYYFVCAVRREQIKKPTDCSRQHNNNNDTSRLKFPITIGIIIIIIVYNLRKIS